MPLPLLMQQRMEVHDHLGALNFWCTYECIDDLGYSLDHEYDIKIDHEETVKGKREHGITYVAYTLWFGDKQITRPMTPVAMTETIGIIIRTTQIAREAYQPRLEPTKYKQHKQRSS
jgi:hypothetical protein